ncbi:type IV pilin N-terminal domain-containing protein [Methanocorpusculum sp. MG]|uniref:Type IV pilin N-terminal domain-containing protein n=1 Tax=Methanocorpusculum petauri TaxID=3002863 RepID=A0ABT4IGV6_9EURY|nr:type IV pilin N-terminal domain-containing protein [Methanocorpusculum petauri]MCZ0860976.1 type IV pilin N-terminal domain-containing protein [Methanocorpusculum petauri]
MKADEGVAPVVAIALLIGLVAIAGALIGLSMFAALESAAGTPPDVRFQVSADGQSLYHAGGDVLPLKNLVFYDTAKKENVEVRLIKSGSSTGSSPAETDVWATGDKIQFDAGILNVLSIVGLDSRNRPSLLYMGAKAMVLPVGDMVPDEWIVTPPKPSAVPTVVPTPPPTVIGENIENIFHPNHAEFTFGSGDAMINLVEKIRKQNLYQDYPLPEGGTPVEFMAHWANYEWTKITVTVYNNETGGTVYTDQKLVEKKEMDTITIPHNDLKKGYVCYVTIEIWKDKERTKMVARQTVVITFT